MYQEQTTTITLSELADNSSYTLFVAAKGGEEYSDVVSRGFTTKVLPEYSLVSKACQGFRVVGRLPDTLPAASVVKWAITDLATYNLNGGAQNDDYWLSRNEAIYPNILAKRYELEIKPETRTFRHTLGMSLSCRVSRWFCCLQSMAREAIASGEWVTTRHSSVLQTLRATTARRLSLPPSRQHSTPSRP